MIFPRDRRSEIENRKLLKVPMQVANDLVPIQIHPRLFAECVMAAGNGGTAVFYVEPLEFANDVT